MEIVYTRQAVLDLQKFGKADQKRIAIKMRYFASTANPLLFAKRLVNSQLGNYRFRIGDIRVVFDITKSTLVVLKIARRDRVYD